MKRKHYVISYDISSDKIRYRVDKLLKSQGIRVQKSVFECDLTESELFKIQKEIRKLIDFETDSVIFYYLCLGCKAAIESFGNYNSYEQKDILII